MTSLPFSHYIKSMQDQAGRSGLIVLGNQAADLDSIASALVLAWHLAGQQPQKNPVALIARRRCDLNLRPELKFVLARAGINPDHLLFRDDVELGKKMAQGAELVLVDHNSLEAPLPPGQQRVTAIIDHHHDQGAFPDASPRIIDQVGSTATLVTELVLREKGEMAASAALLLLSALLMDTVNLSAQAGRRTARDQTMAEKLLALSGVERESFFTSLQQAQHDLKGLSTQQLLGRDYKEWPGPVGRYGMSTVPLSLDQWLQQETDLTSALARFARQKGLTLLIVMLVSYEPDFQRELIIFCRHQELLIHLMSFLEQQGLRLSIPQRSTAVAERDGYLGFYRQDNVSISRKKLQPLIHRFLASLHGKRQE